MAKVNHKKDADFITSELGGWLLACAYDSGTEHQPQYQALEKKLREIKGADFDLWLIDIKGEINDQ